MLWEHEGKNMALNLRFLPDYPAGWSVWAGDEEVAGINHRLHNAKRFAKARNQAIELVLEPSNRHDPNAIKVMGVYQGWFFTRHVHLGYVEAGTAQRIADEGLTYKIRGRLKNIWWGGYVRDYIIVRFDILAPYTPRPQKEKPKRETKSKSKKPKKGDH